MVDARKPAAVAVQVQDTDAAIKMLEFAFRNVGTRALRDVDLHDIALCFAEQRHRLAERARLTTDRSLGAEALENVATVLDGIPFNDIVRARATVEQAAVGLRVIIAAMLAATPPVPATRGEGEKLREAARWRVVEGIAKAPAKSRADMQTALSMIASQAAAALATPDAAPIGSDDAGACIVCDGSRVISYGGHDTGCDACAGPDQ